MSLRAFTVTYLASGGKIGDVIRAEVTCDKCMFCTSMRLLCISGASVVVVVVVGVSAYPGDARVPDASANAWEQLAKPSPTLPSVSRTSRKSLWRVGAIRSEYTQRLPIALGQQEEIRVALFFADRNSKTSGTLLSRGKTRRTLQTCCRPSRRKRSRYLPRENPRQKVI